MLLIVTILISIFTKWQLGLFGTSWFVIISSSFISLMVYGIIYIIHGYFYDEDLICLIKKNFSIKTVIKRLLFSIAFWFLSNYFFYPFISMLMSYFSVFYYIEIMYTIKEWFSTILKSNNSSMMPHGAGGNNNLPAPMEPSTSASGPYGPNSGSAGTRQLEGGGELAPVYFTPAELADEIEGEKDRIIRERRGNRMMSTTLTLREIGWNADYFNRNQTNRIKRDIIRTFLGNNRDLVAYDQMARSTSNIYIAPAFLHALRTR